MNKLVSFNLKMGLVHLVQGIALLILALTVPLFRDFRPEIVGRFFGPVGGGLYAPIEEAMFELPVAILAAAFILLSALFHFLISVPFKKQYLANVEKGINPLRWYEYALSSSIMIVLLSIMFGVTTIEGLLSVFGINAVMNLLGLLMEKMNPPSRTKTDWTAHWIGWIAGLIPWVIIVIYMLNIGDLSVLPWFVLPGLSFYFLVFNLFAFNQILQYARVGKWKDYVYGEKSYVWLSLFGKSILAWLVFIGIILA
ncbi:MAG: heliorhodopsin HeR [Firmicutes bacterium]|jgi:hypothetical protein|nr:heliorhodopsin HeR [Bacillota bacterium]